MNVIYISNEDLLYKSFCKIISKPTRDCVWNKLSYTLDVSMQQGMHTWNCGKPSNKGCIHGTAVNGTNRDAHMELRSTQQPGMHISNCGQRSNQGCTHRTVVNPATRDVHIELRSS